MLLLAALVSGGFVWAGRVLLLLLLLPRCCGIDAVRLGRVMREFVSRVAIWRGAVKTRFGLEGRGGENEVRRGMMVL